MRRDPRTLWSGSAFVFWMLCLAVSLFLILSRCSYRLASHPLAVGFLIFLFLTALFSVFIFPGILILLFFVEGVRVIRHEGNKPANLLSLLFSVGLFGYLTVWPMLGNLKSNSFSTLLYAIISLSVTYGLLLMAMYSLSAVLNLIHLQKARNADYIIVLGSGITGDKVTPLLAARIEKGMELLDYNPAAALIMSGGQGPGEDLPESEAMAEYAIHRGISPDRILTEQRSVSTEENLLFSRELMETEQPRIIIVTTSYHVFRALVLARQLDIPCVGFGSRTKWYFTCNALIREFAGYLSLTWKRHTLVLGTMAGLMAAASIIPRLW